MSAPAGDGPDERTPLLSTAAGTTTTATAPPATAEASAPGKQALSSVAAVEQSDDNDNDVNDNNAAKKKPNLALVIPAIMSGIFMAAADGTIVLVNYATISSELNALNEASWIITAYILGIACFQPLYGKFCDIFGRKTCLITANILFALGSLACGMSTTIQELIAARVLQSIGGSGLGTIVSIILTDLVPFEDRGIWQGVLNLVHLMGAGLGGPLGGLLASSVGWRWAFLLQVPLCMLAIVVIWICLERDPQSLRHANVANGQSASALLLAKLKRIDFLGAVTLITAIAAFVLGLDHGSNVSWVDPECYISMIISGCTAALFLYIEVHVAHEPIMPVGTILGSGIMPVYLGSSMCFFALAALEFTLPLYYQAKEQLSPQTASFYMIPAIVVRATTALATGFWMRRRPTYYYAILIGCACQIISGVILFLFSGPLGESVAMLIIGQAVTELAVGNNVVSGLIAVISTGSEDSVAIRTAAYYSFRNMGPVLGVSVVSSIIQQSLRDLLEIELPRRGHNVDEIVDEVRKSLDNLRRLDPKVVAIVRDCYGQAMNRGFLLILIVAVLSAIPAVLVRGGRGKKEKKAEDPGSS